MSATALEFVPCSLHLYYVAPIDRNMLYGFIRHATDMKWTITVVSDLLASVVKQNMCAQILGMQFSSIDMLVNMMSLIISNHYPTHVDNDPLANMYIAPVCTIPDRLFVEDLHRIPVAPRESATSMKRKLLAKGWISPKDLHDDWIVSASMECHIADLYRVYVAYLDRIRKCITIVAPVMSLINPKM